MRELAASCLPSSWAEAWQEYPTSKRNCPLDMVLQYSATDSVVKKVYHKRPQVFSSAWRWTRVTRRQRHLTYTLC